MLSLRNRLWALALALTTVLSGIALVAQASPGDEPCWPGAAFECGPGPSGRANGSSTSSSRTSTTTTSTSKRSSSETSTRSSSKSTTTTTTAKVQLPTFSITNPAENEEVGIAQPISLTFDKKLDADEKNSIAKAIQVKTGAGTIAGRVNWRNDENVTIGRWRPDEYWPPNSNVEVTVGNAKRSFKVGIATITFVNDTTHLLTVFKNGQQVNQFPISMGKPGYVTPRGDYYVSEKFAKDYRMKSDPGSPEQYDVRVNWATRFTSKGNFVHAYEDTVAQQGVSNVTHGCVNASNVNAQWYFENVRKGDPIVIENTGAEELSNLDQEMYADWNIGPRVKH